jgi:hypothetical protein
LTQEVNMPRKREKRIPVAEYLADAIRHIEQVAGSVRRTIEGRPRLRLDATETGFRVFARGCGVVSAIPPPFGGGCVPGPKDIRGRVERQSAQRTMRRSSRARKRVKR